jgi:hypothetical protein
MHAAARSSAIIFQERKGEAFAERKGETFAEIK